MRKALLAAIILLLTGIHATAQLGVMKLVGNNTNNYQLGYGAFIKGAFPVSAAADVTVEIGANIFFLNDGYGDADGTIICPLKAGYRYTLNGTGTGLYIEPQLGYDLLGVTSLHDADGNQINQKYHGVIFSAGTGYLFSIWDGPVDLNLRYETVIDDGGSTNYISLGICTYIRFKKRDSEDE